MRLFPQLIPGDNVHHVLCIPRSIEFTKDENSSMVSKQIIQLMRKSNMYFIKSKSSPSYTSSYEELRNTVISKLHSDRTDYFTALKPSNKSFWKVVSSVNIRQLIQVVVGSPSRWNLNQVHKGDHFPKSQGAISDLAGSLFNGVKRATIKRGEMQPRSMAVISANFMTCPQEKYVFCYRKGVCIVE